MQARFDAVRERAERGARERFGSNRSENPNSSLQRGAAQGRAASRGGGKGAAPGNKAIVFMSEDEMVSASAWCWRGVTIYVRTLKWRSWYMVMGAFRSRWRVVVR